MDCLSVFPSFHLSFNLSVFPSFWPFVSLALCFFCLSVYLSLCLSLSSLSYYQSVFLSVCLCFSILLSVCQSLSFNPSICLSVSVFPSFYLSVSLCLSILLSVCLSLSFHPPISVSVSSIIKKANTFCTFDSRTQTNNTILAIICHKIGVTTPKIFRDYADICVRMRFQRISVNFVEETLLPTFVD